MTYDKRDEDGFCEGRDGVGTTEWEGGNEGLGSLGMKRFCCHAFLMKTSNHISHTHIHFTGMNTHSSHSYTLLKQGLDAKL